MTLIMPAMHHGGAWEVRLSLCFNGESDLQFIILKTYHAFTALIIQILCSWST